MDYVDGSLLLIVGGQKLTRDKTVTMQTNWLVGKKASAQKIVQVSSWLALS